MTLGIITRHSSSNPSAESLHEEFKADVSRCDTEALLKCTIFQECRLSGQPRELQWIKDALRLHNSFWNHFIQPLLDNWPEVIFMAELQPELQMFDVETMTEKKQEMQTIATSTLSCRVLKYFAVAERSLAEQLLSVSRTQWRFLVSLSCISAIRVVGALI